MSQPLGQPFKLTRLKLGSQTREPAFRPSGSTRLVSAVPTLQNLPDTVQHFRQSLNPGTGQLRAMITPPRWRPFLPDGLTKRRLTRHPEIPQITPRTARNHPPQ